MTRYRDVALLYTELMTPAIVDGLNEVAAERYDRPLDAFSAAQIAVALCVESLDLEHPALPEPVATSLMDGRREYVKILAEAACDDATDLMTYCEKFVASHELPAKQSFNAVLKASKPALLRPAQLRDGRSFSMSDRGIFFGALLHGTPDRLAYVFGTPLETMLEQGTALDGTARLKWQSPVDTWLKARMYPERGCPAAHHIVQQEGGARLPVLHLFWDRLVDLAYPEEG